MKKIITTICIVILLIIGILVFKYYDNQLVTVDDVKTDKSFVDVTYNRVEDVWDDSVLGVLTIEKIGLKATVKEGSNDTVLKDYIGHIEDTATYDGNVGLAGHNRGNDYSYFARINELQEGDIIEYQTKFYKRKYKVDNIQVIYETDWSLLKDTEENKITMITCISNKRNQRYCVQATEIL